MIEKLHEASLKSGYSRSGVAMTAVKRTAVKRMVTMAMMAALLTGPVAAPNAHPGRPCHGCYPWHVFMDWLGYRRRVRPGSGETNQRRRNKAR